MNFYKFYQLLENNYEEESVNWTSADDDSKPVWIVDNKFIDENKYHLKWLDPWVEEAKSWTKEEHKNLPWIHQNPDLFNRDYFPKNGRADFSKALWITFKVKFGEIPEMEDPITGKYIASKIVDVNIEDPVLTNDKNKIDLNIVKGQIESHYFKQYK